MPWASGYRQTCTAWPASPLGFRCFGFRGFQAKQRGHYLAPASERVHCSRHRRHSLDKVLVLPDMASPARPCSLPPCTNPWAPDRSLLKPQAKLRSRYAPAVHIDIAVVVTMTTWISARHRRPPLRPTPLPAPVTSVLRPGSLPPCLVVLLLRLHFVWHLPPCASLEALKEVAAVELRWVWALPTMPSPQLPMLLALQGVHLQEAPLALQQRGLRLQIAAAPQWR